ncbi:MAG: DUF4426 domain-containing protein [Pseudomonadota bacterium]|nr:hypothetical protein [Pseudomonadales bacterium]MDY6921370.1 DUF4426 domain-containing protein [Pseudomonadota bacterium]
MTMKRTSFKLLLGTLLALALFSVAELAAASGQYLEDDQYIVHYSAFNASMLTPQVAKAYDLNRSRQRGVLSIAVQRKQPEGPPVPVMAQLKGFTGQLGGSEIPLKFQLVEEGKAIYYLAQFLIDDGETLDFDVKIRPTPEYPPMALSFSQIFFEE